MPEKWQRISEVFNSALQCEPSERSNYVRQACANDDSMRQEIESLLANYDKGFLEDSPVGNMPSFRDRMIGRQVGAYRILAECGHGGMAVVYVAERADQEYRKRVAIKMVKPGANTREILRRFRNERQTLAVLDHPNIVKLLDGGSTEEGLPYLVMEYVEGVPVDQYCDDHKLSIRERLELFCTICSVVQYAHSHQVIHRDLKPSNILITSEGRPRLLDFGIAKLLNPELFQTRLVTQGDWRPMTPEYASPEQVRGDPITDASDTYSLGVVLYQLLTGHRPYRAPQGSLLELQRQVCETEPERPSTAVNLVEEANNVVGGSRITPQSVSAARQAQPDELRRRLQGDLDTIVLMALRKEPARRYASAMALEQDLKRHIEGLPVLARKPTLRYRSGKFVGRHLESLATAVVVLALVSGVGTWIGRRAWRPAPKSNATQVQGRPSVAVLGFKDLSNRPDSAWISTALSEMLTTELAAGERLRTVPGETVARARTDLKLPDSDSLAAETLTKIHRNLGTDFIVLGSYFDAGKDAGGQLRLDLRLQDTVKGETVAAVSETGSDTQLLELVSRTGARLRERLGVSEVSPAESAALRAAVSSSPEAMRLYAEGLSKQRSFDALSARDLLTKAIAVDPSFALAHSALAQTWTTLGYDSKALQEAKRALELGNRLSRENRLLIEARYYEANRQLDKGVETYGALFSFFPDNVEYGLDLARAQVLAGRGKDALNTLAALGQLGETVREDPRVDIAIADAAGALSDNKLRRDAAERAAAKADKQGARLLVAWARSTGCRALANLGENDKAKAECEEARRIFQEAGDRANLARTLHSVAEVPLNQGDYLGAEKLYKQELGLAQETGDKRGIGRALVNLGVVYKSQGDLVRALEAYDAALQNDRETGDRNALPVVMGNRATVLRKQGRMREALQQYRETLALSEEIGNKSSSALAMANMGETLFETGDLAGAYKMYQQSAALQREIGQKRYYAFTLVDIGQVLQQQGKFEEAMKQFTEALAIQQQLGETGSMAESRMALADLYCQYDKGGDAESSARLALQYFQSQKDSADEMLTQAELACGLLEQGKLNEAREAIGKAKKLAETSKDVSYRLPVEIQAAYVQFASHDIKGARDIAAGAVDKATKFGFVGWQLQASLALGTVETKDDPVAGRSRLARLQRVAKAKGYEVIANRATAALMSKTP